MYKLTLLLIMIFGFISCQDKSTETYWVGGYKQECQGVGKMQCMLVTKGETLQNANWQLFYDKIEGFEFKEGMLQKIIVEIEQLDPKTVPADASSVKYKLIEVVETIQDNRVLINDKWELQNINQGKLETDRVPFLEFKLNENKVSGNNSCNNYFGNIKVLTNDRLKFGNIASTKRLCQDMTVADAYDNALQAVSFYNINGDNLKLLTESKEEILSFKKYVKPSFDSRIYDIWNAVRINGNPINRMATIPRLEVNTSKMQVFGNDGCNEFNGTIKSITDTNIELGQIASTQKMCIKMQTADAFNKALNTVSSYKIDGTTLMLFDASGNEVLAFLKGD